LLVIASRNMAPASCYNPDMPTQAAALAAPGRRIEKAARLYAETSATDVTIPPEALARIRKSIKLVAAMPNVGAKH
jgi:hypothetical protein